MHVDAESFNFMNFVLMVITVNSVGLWKKLLLTKNIH